MDWQKQSWVDVPPGTTAPAGAPARDAAYHLGLDDELVTLEQVAASREGVSRDQIFVGDIAPDQTIYARWVDTSGVAPVMKEYDGTAWVDVVYGGGSTTLTEIGISDVFIPDSSLNYGPIYAAQMFSPRLSDLQITGIRLPFTYRADDACSAVVHFIDNFEEATKKYSRALRLAGLADFISQGNTEQTIMFSSPIPLVAGSIYEVGIGLDESLVSTGVPLVGGTGLPHFNVPGIKLSAIGAAESRTGVLSHYFDGGLRMPIVVLCEQTGAVHTDEPIAVSDPYSTIEPASDPVGQLTPYYVGREFGGRCYHSYTIAPTVNLSVTGAVAELTSLNDSLAITLYDSAHVVLAETTFTGDGANQSISFAAAQTLTAGETYEIAYRATTDTAVGVVAYLDVGPRTGNSDLQIVQSYRDFNTTDGSQKETSVECGRLKILYTV